MGCRNRFWVTNKIKKNNWFLLDHSLSNQKIRSIKTPGKNMVQISWCPKQKKKSVCRVVNTQNRLTFDCDTVFLSKFQGWWDHRPIGGVVYVTVIVSYRQRHPIRIQVQQFLSRRILSTETLVAMQTVFFFCRSVNALYQLKRNWKQGKQKKLQLIWLI